MKILIFSDSHGSGQGMRTAIEREAPDRIFHLGDVLSDARRLSDAYPDLPMDCVAGNCDGWTAQGEGVSLVTAGGVRFFLTHGHLYHAKSGLDLLMEAGRERAADVVCFGHTHSALNLRWQNGLWAVNPGTVGGIGAQATYAVGEAENGAFTCRIVAV